MAYAVPVQALSFWLRLQAPAADQVAGELGVLQRLAAFADAVFVPLQAQAVPAGASLQADGSVSLPSGFEPAFQAFAAAGWQRLRHAQALGGMALSRAAAAAGSEMLAGACMALAAAPQLSDHVIELLAETGSAAQRQRWLPALLRGDCCGTLSLLPSAVHCRAEPLAEGGYSLSGTSDFICYGEHEMSANILHLVLARLPGAAEPSLFAVPKWCEAGGARRRNAVHADSLDHKLGAHGSPTMSVRFGGAAGLAHGELLGAAGQGAALIAAQLDQARFEVGVQAVALGERALQMADAHVLSRPPQAGTASLHERIDQQRMLLTMRALTAAGRSFYLHLARLQDLAGQAEAPDAALHRHLLIPVLKVWTTEQVQKCSGLAVQIFGGRGRVESNGVAQLFRDARMLGLAAGPNTGQARELLCQGLLRDRGALFRRLLAQIWDTEADLQHIATPDLLTIRRFLVLASEALERAVDHVVMCGGEDSLSVAGVASELLMLLGDVVAGWRLAEDALGALELAQEHPQAGDAACMAQRQARFYAEHILSKCPGREAVIVMTTPLLDMVM